MRGLEAVRVWGCGVAAFESLAGRLLMRALVARPETVLEWVEGHIVDPSAGTAGRVRLDPYQREPLAAMDCPEYETVVLQLPPRVGKSSLYLYYLAYCAAQKPAPVTACFATDDAVREFLEERFEPLLRRIPDLGEQLDRRAARTSGRYRFRDWFLKYQGSYAPISATTARLAIGDELNDWSVQVSEGSKRSNKGKRVDNVRNLEMRTQTYARRGRMTVLVSSPTDGSRIEREWEAGSRGTWHLRCLGCGELSPSNVWSWRLSGGGYAGLQFAREDGGAVVQESIRWVCPLCGRGHPESEAQALNDRGAWIHQSPGHRRRTYTAGALCCPRAFPWVQVAEAIVDAGHSLAARIKLANHYAGQPLLEGSQVDLAALAPLRSRVAPVDPAALCGVVVAVDRQGYETANFFCCDTWGIDAQGNMRHLHSVILNSVEDVLALETHEVHGMRPLVVLVDVGGFSRSGLPDLSESAATWWYKGDSQTKYSGLPLRVSENESRLILANPNYYKVELLSRLYGPDRQSDQLFFTASDDDAYYVQIASMQPIKGANGDAFAHYQPRGRHDWFDTAKMALTAVDFASLNFHWKSWRGAGKTPPPFVVQRTRTHLRLQG